MMQRPLSINGTSKVEEALQSTFKNRNQNIDTEIEQATPQEVIDSLTRYTVRKNGAYLSSDCGICQRKFDVGNNIVCLPCQHIFHGYCIENWLKWVKSSCPIDKKSVIRTNYWTELENERSKSKKINALGKNDQAISSTDQIRTEGKTAKGTLNIHSNENPSSPEKASNNRGNYPILISSLPMLKRFSLFMSSNKGSDSSLIIPHQNKQLSSSSVKKPQVQDLQKLQKNQKPDSPTANKRKFQKNSYSSALQKYFEADSFSPNPTNSSNDFPYNWIVPHKKDNGRLERPTSTGGIKNSRCTEYNEEMARPKIVVKRTVTFADAFTQPVKESRGWVYKKRVGSSPRNLK